MKAATGGVAPCDFVLRGAAELVTMGGTDGCGLVVDGALAAREGRIAWVGPERDLDCFVAVADDAVVVDAEGAVVLPGFVDPHTHAVFAGSRAGEYAERLAGRTYSDILKSGGGINATVRATRAAAAEELATLTQRRLDSFLTHGTTTLEIKSGYGLTLVQELKILAAAAVEHPVRRVRTFLGAHAVPDEFAERADDYVELVCTEMLPALGGEAEFVDVL